MRGQNLAFMSFADAFNIKNVSLHAEISPFEVKYNDFFVDGALLDFNFELFAKFVRIEANPIYWQCGQ